MSLQLSWHQLRVRVCARVCACVCVYHRSRVPAGPGDPPCWGHRSSVHQLTW